MIGKQLWIYDLEQYINFHSATFMSVDGKTTIQFVIHKSRNDYDRYMHFLRNYVSGLVGFNNIGYDYHLIHYLLVNEQKLTKYTADAINILLFDISNKLIESEKTVWPKKILIPQLDLYLIWHFNNKAKITSLKGVGIALKHENIQDLPFAPSMVISEDGYDQIPEILVYNKNDVEITRKFFIYSLDKIKMREEFGKKYGMNLMNANDPAIGSKIMQQALSAKLGLDPKELAQMRTKRENGISLKDIILPYIKFSSAQFQSVLDKMMGTTIYDTEEGFTDSVIFDHMKYDFGAGGIHGAIESGIYKSGENNQIVLVDVSSYYPNIGIKNKFFPKHLTVAFCEVYSNIYDQRLMAKMTHDKVVNEGLKLALNASFGKSNDQYSFFYDPKYLLRITINGQLLLCMLAETIVQKGIKIIQINTDGIMVDCPKDKLIDLKSACAEWEELTGLKLDFDYFKQVVMRDVNNYLAEFDNGKTKQKGVFEVDKEIHKDHSMRVVRLAVLNYYTKGIPVEKTIMEHDDIYDFCLRFRANSGWKVVARYLDKKDNKEKEATLQKNVRYYVRNNGALLQKVHSDSRRINILSDYTVQVFNKYKAVPMSAYQINYGFYIKQAYDIIYSVSDGQMKLF